jgi:hypothetical protein
MAKEKKTYHLLYGIIVNRPSISRCISRYEEDLAGKHTNRLIPIVWIIILDK